MTDPVPPQFVTFFYLGDDPALKALYPQNPQGLTGHNVCIICDKPFEHGALFIDTGATGAAIIVADQVCALVHLGAPRDLALKLLAAREELERPAAAAPEKPRRPLPVTTEESPLILIEDLDDDVKSLLFGQGSLADGNPTVASIQKLVLAVEYITRAELSCLKRIVHNTPGQFPLITEQRQIEGRVVSIYTKFAQHGPVTRLIFEVETDNGRDITFLWGTCPKPLLKAKRGDLIKLYVVDTSPGSNPDGRFGFFRLPRGRQPAHVVTAATEPF